MQNQNEKRYYSPQFSALASISVRRFAWAIKKPMPAAVDLIVRLMPHVVSPSKICSACQDKTKCLACVFSNKEALTADQIAILEAAV